MDSGRYQGDGPMKLTPRAKEILLLAYSNEHILEPDQEGVIGPSPRAVTNLTKRGLLERSEADDPLSEHDITADGRAALGIEVEVEAAPRNLKETAEQAVSLFFGVEARLGSFLSVEQLSAPERGSFEDALMGLALTHETADEDGLRWACVATYLCEHGFSVEVEVTEDYAVFWNHESDD